jgi:hypothetical protein
VRESASAPRPILDAALALPPGTLRRTDPNPHAAAAAAAAAAASAASAAAGLGWAGGGAAAVADGLRRAARGAGSARSLTRCVRRRRRRSLSPAAA